MSEEYFPVHVP